MVYDFLEWTLNLWPAKQTFAHTVNDILERELGGFRFVDKMFTPITDRQEIQALTEALKDRDSRAFVRLSTLR